MKNHIQDSTGSLHSRKRVLVVDDDKDIVSGLSVRLEAAGYEVFSAYDGAAGYDAALATHPDAMILDMRMPVMDGLSMLAKLRERAETRTTPVIVLSASLRDHQMALDMGARYFLDKPCDPRTLLTALHTVSTLAPAVA
jgi:DNA-binding response OmpR family regulator